MSAAARRRAVVGGASSGLGRACATALAETGHDLLVWSRNAERLHSLAGELSDRFGVAVHVQAEDASSPDAAESVAAAADERLGGADVCVLNAGGPPPCPPDRTDPSEWRRSLQLLAITPIELATRVLPGMRERGYGRIVAILSSGVREPLPELCYSNSGRAALTAWLKTVAGPVAADGVTVNGVLPGRIGTPRVDSLDAAQAERRGIDVAEVRAQSETNIPIHRYGTPEEFAAVVSFLASPEASYVTGAFVSCDGGMARSTM
jgi:3-oxoacyl-[acyl-carrier protein] reductase